MISLKEQLAYLQLIRDDLVAYSKRHDAPLKNYFICYSLLRHLDNKFEFNLVENVMHADDFEAPSEFRCLFNAYREQNKYNEEYTTVLEQIYVMVYCEKIDDRAVVFNKANQLIDYLMTGKTDLFMSMYKKCRENLKPFLTTFMRIPCSSKLPFEVSIFYMAVITQNEEAVVAMMADGAHYRYEEINLAGEFVSTQSSVIQQVVMSDSSVEVLDFIKRTDPTVDLDAPGFNAFPPLFHAIKGSRPEFVRKLLDLGTNPDAQLFGDGLRAITYACEMYSVNKQTHESEKRLQIISLLSDYGADLDERFLIPIVGSEYTNIRANVLEFMLMEFTTVLLTNTMSEYAVVARSAEGAHIDVRQWQYISVKALFSPCFLEALAKVALGACETATLFDDFPEDLKFTYGHSSKIVKHVIEECHKELKLSDDEDEVAFFVDKLQCAVGSFIRQARTELVKGFLSELASHLDGKYNPEKVPKLKRLIRKVLTSKMANDGRSSDLFFDAFSRLFSAQEAQVQRVFFSEPLFRQHFCSNAPSCIHVDLCHFFILLNKYGVKRIKNVAESYFNAFKPLFKDLECYGDYEALFQQWHSQEHLDAFLKATARGGLIPKRTVVVEVNSTQKSPERDKAKALAQAQKEREEKAKIDALNQAAAAAKEKEKAAKRRAFELRRQAEEKAARNKAEKKSRDEIKPVAAMKEKEPVKSKLQQKPEQPSKNWSGVDLRKMRVLTKSSEDALLWAGAGEKASKAKPTKMRQKASKLSIDEFLTRHFLNQFRSEFVGIESASLFAEMGTDGLIVNKLNNARRAYMLINLAELVRKTCMGFDELDPKAQAVKAVLLTLRHRLAHSQGIDWSGRLSDGKRYSLHDFMNLLLSHQDDAKLKALFKIDERQNGLKGLLEVFNAISRRVKTIIHKGSHKKRSIQFAEPELLRAAKGLILQLHHCVKSMPSAKRKMVLNDELRTLLSLRNTLAHEPEAEAIEGVTVSVDLRKGGQSVDQILLDTLKCMPMIDVDKIASLQAGETPCAGAGGAPAPQSAMAFSSRLSADRPAFVTSFMRK